MRHLVIAAAVFCAAPAWAQSVSIGDSIMLFAPGLAVRVVQEVPRVVNGADQCATDFPTIWGCPGSPAFPPSWGIHGPFTIGFDAVGNAYHVSGDGSNILRRVSPRGVTEDVAQIVRFVSNSEFNPQGAILDATNGRIWILMFSWYSDASGKHPATVGVVEISGLATLFDTLLTFTPTGQMLSAVTPAHPDGFRSADSLQVWAGDVATLPDWSRAQPVTCDAATPPSPGLIVTISDTLPDPAVGAGRYYVVASQSGLDRRLGRQYVNGTFAARYPGRLPVCNQSLPGAP